LIRVMICTITSASEGISSRTRSGVPSPFGDPCNGFAGDVDDLSSGVEPDVRPGSLAS
jgi:hypothetical protein